MCAWAEDKGCIAAVLCEHHGTEDGYLPSPYDVQAYAEWNPDNDVSAGISQAQTVDELRETSTSHRIISVDEAVEWVRGGAMLNLSPLCGGVPPAIAWPYLKRVGEVVLPAADRAADVAGSPDGVNNELTELISNKRM